MAEAPLQDDAADFEAFIAGAQKSLEKALTWEFGVDRARELTNDAVSYAWEHWDVVGKAGNPAGYLYRVAVRQGRKRRTSLALPEPSADALPDFEPRLPQALATLSSKQRIVVMLVHGDGWPVVEVARLLGVSESSVQTHLRRGMNRLRRQLHVGGDDDEA